MTTWTPARVTRKPPRPLLRMIPPVTVTAAFGVGYIGAGREQQARWLASFRRLLDGLDRPVQFIAGFHASGEREVLLVGPAALAADLRAIGLRTATRPSPDHTTAFGLESPFLHQDRFGCHRTWYLDRFAGDELEAGWLLALAPGGIDVTISWHVEPMPTGWAVEYLRRQLAHMRAAHLETARRGLPDVQLDQALPAAQQLQRKLAASEERAFQVATYVSVRALNKDRLEAAAAQLEAAARAALVTLRAATFRQWDARLAVLPLGIDRLGRRRILDSSSLTTFFPWLDADVRDPAGASVGTSRATALDVAIDPFDQRRYENANIGIFGHSGAGKTYLMKTILAGAAERGLQIFVIDPEHEYGALATRLGGRDIQLSPGSGHSLNVMDLQPSTEAVADTVDLLDVICGRLDEVEKAAAEEAIRHAYLEIENPVLADVAVRLGPGRVAKILQRWSTGALGRMFSEPTNIDLDAPVVVFGMREMREELVAPVHFLLAEALWRRIRSRARRTLLVVDELGLLFDDPTIRRFVVRLARRIRKYDGSLVFATQNPGDLLSSDAGTVVATNPAIVFFGSQRPNEAAKLARAFDLSDSQRQFLEAGRRGEFLLCAGHDRLPLTVRAPAGHHELILDARA